MQHIKLSSQFCSIFSCSKAGCRMKIITRDTTQSRSNKSTAHSAALKIMLYTKYDLYKVWADVPGCMLVGCILKEAVTVPSTAWWMVANDLQRLLCHFSAATRRHEQSLYGQRIADTTLYTSQLILRQFGSWDTAIANIICDFYRVLRVVDSLLQSLLFVADCDAQLLAQYFPTTSYINMFHEAGMSQYCAASL